MIPAGSVKEVAVEIMNVGAVSSVSKTTTVSAQFPDVAELESSGSATVTTGARTPTWVQAIIPMAYPIHIGVLLHCAVILVKDIVRTTTSVLPSIAIPSRVTVLCQGAQDLQTQAMDTVACFSKINHKICSPFTFLY